MKRFLFLLSFCVVFTMSLKAQIVTGQILYEKQHNFQSHEIFQFEYLKRTISMDIDQIDTVDIKLLLVSAGVNFDSILYVDAFGSSTEDKVEIFFAYLTVDPKIKARENVTIINPKHRASLGYSAKNGIIVPAFTHINKPELEDLLWQIATDYQITSFMVKPFTMEALPPLVLTRPFFDGTLADMRWINDSYQYVDAFKALRWRIIWYKDANGKQKGIMYPKY